jgi:tRNA pseudouridine55 synthase
MNAPRSTRVAIDGWLVLDKPVGMTSTHAVARAKRIFNAKKAGHAGTLDPLASGILPIALGEATKTVPFVQDGEKTYRFAVRWGTETDTDDADGKPVEHSAERPSRDAIVGLLPSFMGTILQRPPAFSAIKIAGERAYDLARDGELVDIAPRPVTISSLALVDDDADEAVFVAECGKGTYVRAIARDLGRLLGCYGYVTALRRTRVGPFDLDGAVALMDLEAEPLAYLHPVAAGLASVACVTVDRSAAARLRRGQSVLVRGRDAPAEGPAWASCGGVAIALGTVEGGELMPSRVFTNPY